MDAVTYPDEGVIDYIAKNLIPLRLPYNHERYAKEFKIEWTPTLIVLDSRGNEGCRSTGFLPPDELIPWLQMGRGKAHFAAHRYGEAIEAFDFVINRYPKSKFTAEAIYYRGVSLYKHTNNAKPLREVYDRLSADYPDGEWTQKSYPYRLIA
jgi:tetratricopeptide (TPR) repeat protein